MAANGSGDGADTGGPVRYPDVYGGRSYADPVGSLTSGAGAASARAADREELEAGARQESDVFADTYQVRAHLLCVMYSLSSVQRCPSGSALSAQPTSFA